MPRAHDNTADARLAIRDRILDGAAACVLDFGHGRTTINDIAVRSKLSRATIYNHVGNHQAVMSALFRREMERFLQMVIAVFESEPDVRLAIVEAVAGFVRGARSSALFRRELELEPGMVLPWLTTQSDFILKGGRRWIAPYIRRGIDAGQLHEIDPELTAEWITRIALGLLVSSDPAGDFADDRLPAVVRQLVIGGLGG